MKKVILIMGLLFCFLVNFAQETGTFTDPRDGKTYTTIKINDMWVMAENLAYAPSEGNYWAVEGDNSTVAQVGYLYDRATALKIAPEGWHLPTSDEWQTIYNYYGGNGETVYNAVKKYGTGAFNASLTGYAAYGTFYGGGRFGFFWSSTLYDLSNAYAFKLDGDYYKVYIDYFSMDWGFCVRLIKNY